MYYFGSFCDTKNREFFLVRGSLSEVQLYCIIHFNFMIHFLSQLTVKEHADVSLDAYYLFSAPLEEITPNSIPYWSLLRGGGKRCMLTFHQPYHISRVRSNLTDIRATINELAL